MKGSGRILGIVAVVLWSLAPFAWPLISSLKPAQELVSLPPILPSQATLEHYLAVFAGHPFLRIIANSFVVAASTTVLALGVAAPAAFALTKLKVRGRGLILAGVLSISMFPPIATVSPLFLLINALGLRDTLTALILIYTTFSLPLAIWVLTNFFRTIPDEIYFASRVDGCTALRSFCQVILLLSAPGFVTAALLVFIFCWNEFLYALSFTATEAARTIPVAIALFPGLHEGPGERSPPPRWWSRCRCWSWRSYFTGASWKASPPGLSRGERWRGYALSRSANASAMPSWLRVSPSR